MAAGGETEFRRRLVEYIDKKSDGTELKKVLPTKSADIKYDLLMSVRDDNAWTGVFRAAMNNDVEMVRCMLAEFTPEQAYNVLKLQTGGNTPLHRAAGFGRVEMVKYLLSCVNQQQRFNLLKMKGYYGRTVLRVALDNNERDTATEILSTLPLQQQLQLINIKDEYNKSVADLYSDLLLPVELVAKGLAELKSTVDGQAAVIAEQKREIAGQKREAAELKQEIQRGKDKQTEQEKKFDGQDAVIAAQNELIAKQKGEMVDQKQEAAQLKQEIQRGKDKQTELEKKLSALEEKFDIFIRTPIVLGGEDDHVHGS